MSLFRSKGTARGSHGVAMGLNFPKCKAEEQTPATEQGPGLLEMVTNMSSPHSKKLRWT